MTSRNRLIASAVTIGLLLVLMAGLARTGVGGTAAQAVAGLLILWNLYTGWKAFKDMRP